MDFTKIHSSTSTQYPFQLHHFFSLHHLQKIRRSLFALLSLFLLLLLAYNGASLFCMKLPFPANTPQEAAGFSPEFVPGESIKWVSSSMKLSSSVMRAVKEENPLPVPEIHMPLVHKSRSLVSFTNISIILGPTDRGPKPKSELELRLSKASQKAFPLKVKEFFGKNSLKFSCKIKFFMTWISSLESFGDRELLAIEALFKSHPNGCLIIVSNSMDSEIGKQVLNPFWDKGFRVTAISPDFNYLFKNTPAESWLDQLRRGDVQSGEVSLGQNLSNLLRLGLLYRFGGVYMDTDVVILRSFKKLRNAIGAQTIDDETKKWSRLNNAVMIFDKGHPLLFKFIQEFALTFDGNKWGHNGPYLVSRVVSRISGRPGFNFTILPPMTFYPVDWRRIGSFFQVPRNETESKWLDTKLHHIRSRSFAVHLWNKQSRGLKVEEGSIIGQFMSECCIICNSSSASTL